MLAITIALGRWEEFRLHTRAALEQKGLTEDEVREVLIQSAIYAGVPAANTAFAMTEEIISAELQAGMSATAVPADHVGVDRRRRPAPRSGHAAPAEPPPKPAYPPPAPQPTQEGPRGMRYDFNLGCRVVLPPQPGERPWRVRLRDLDTGNTLFETTLQQGFINSSKRWFVRFRIEVWDGEERASQHDYDARAAAC